MSFTPRERSIAFLRDLQNHFSEWMEGNGIFDDLMIESLELLERLQINTDDELTKREEELMVALTSELIKWADQLKSLNAGQSKSRNNLSQFIGGNGNRRWEVYHPENSPIKSEKCLNLRPIGTSEIKFNIHKDLDLDFVHVINREIESISWDLFRLNLDNQPGVFVGSIPAWELELACNVPSLESDISKEEAANRILDNQRSKDRWQRQINPKNRESIAMFFSNQNTFFANPVIIHDPESKFLNYKIDESNGITKATIDLSYLVESRSIKLVDGSRVDSRPLTVIDGQHRIRGAALAPTNYDQRLLVVLLPPEISESAAGKLFAEINTLSKPLKEKHRIFLSHRFNVSSPDPKFTFSKFDEKDPKTNRDRANAMSYEFAARLSINDNCEFLENKIRFLDQNSSTTLFSIEKWLEYTYPWFQDFPYTQFKEHSNEFILTELSNYFESWHDIIGKKNWAGDSTCLFRTKLQFRVILQRFEQIYEKAKYGIPNDQVIPKKNFLKILEPLKNIPFTNTEVFDQYNDSGEDTWKFLDAWVHDAIKYASEIHSTEDILDVSNIGIPGAGIISPPIDSEEHQIDVPPGGLFPVDNKTKYLKAHRPRNCGYSCNIRLGYGDQLFPKASVASKRIEKSENIPIRSIPQIQNIKSGLYLELEWGTISSKVVKRIEIN